VATLRTGRKGRLEELSRIRLKFDSNFIFSGSIKRRRKMQADLGEVAFFQPIEIIVQKYARFSMMIRGVRGFRAGFALTLCLPWGELLAGIAP
jgi:hypothetical protein